MTDPPSKSALISLSGFCQAGLFAAMMATILGFAGSWWWIFDLCAHFRAHLALGFLCFAGFYLVTRNRRMMVFCLIGLLPNLLCLAPYLPYEEPYSGGYQVLAANLLSSNTNHQALLDLIDKEEPEFLVLLEVDSQWESALSVLKERYPFQLIEAREDNFGIAVLSVMETDRAEIIYMEPYGLPAIQATWGSDDPFGITLFAVHPIPPIDGDHTAARNLQLARVLERLEGVKAQKMVVGDLNATPWSAPFLAMLDSGLVDTARGRGYQATWPAVLGPLGIPIDHILCSPETEILRRRVGPAIGSDHLPILLEFRTK